MLGTTKSGLINITMDFDICTILLGLYKLHPLTTRGLALIKKRRGPPVVRGCQPPCKGGCTSSIVHYLYITY